ncbi:MAG: B12-binding domain-containing radical SAM protein, partial [Candidatus Hodarchaeota archaeon]
AEWRGLRPHLGIGYLAEALVDSGIQHDILDMNLGYKIKKLAKKIEKFRPDLIGMPLISLQYLEFYRLLSQIKDHYPHVDLVVGGPHVTILKEKVLNDCPAIDYGATFEGEIPLVELCKGERPLNEIKSLLYKEDDNHSVVYSGDGEPIWDLDRLSFPRYGKFELRKYIPEITIYSSRGCPHQCIFCPNHIISPRYRARSAAHVVDEMEYWHKNGFQQFNFDDDNFNYDKERVYQICDEIDKRGMRNLFLRCSNGIRADRVDRDMLKRMKEVGFHYIAFGADAGNNRMLKIVKKGETIEQIESAVKNAYELGYDVKLLFVVGTPYETQEDVEDKVRLARKYPLNDVHFYNTIPYPGTELFDWVVKKNYFLIKPEEYLNDISCCESTPVFETPELTAKERVRLYEYLQKVRRDIHRKAFRRMYERLGILSSISSYFFTSDFAVKLFYQNFLIRRLIEKLRYKKAIVS